MSVYGIAGGYAGRRRRGARSGRVKAPAVILQFTMSGTPAAAPTITAAGAADTDFIWHGPAGDFTGKAPALGNFVAGSYYVVSTKGSLVTALSTWNAKNLTDFRPTWSRLPNITNVTAHTNAALTTDVSGWVLPPNLATLAIYNTAVSGDVSGWVLPPSLVYLGLSTTGVSGDVSGWVLPASMVTLYLYNTAVSGDISGWVLPASMTTLYLYGTGVSGDISGWVLPASLTYLYLYNTAVSGNVSGWVLPASMVILSLYNTAVSGDISGWVLPASLTTLYIHNTAVSGDVSRWVLPASLTYLYLGSTAIDYGAGGLMGTATRNGSTYYFNNCGMVTAEVDAILANAVASATVSSTLNVGPNNQAPTGGVANADYVLLTTAIGSGGRGWTVTITP